jgi:hypothetical protein
MTRIKIVPDSDLNADGRWIEVPVSLAPRTRWRAMEELVKPHIPAGHHAVAVEPGESFISKPRLSVV